MFQAIQRCRVCGNPTLPTLLHLGEQYLTGVFPRSTDAALTCGPLELVKCHGPLGGGHCGLVQLRHSYDLAEMYGDNYGYRSSLNRSMVQHLGERVAGLLKLVPPRPDDLIIDIGSNDGTLLSFYPTGGPTLLGIDPTAAKFRAFYRKDIDVITNFFSAEAVRRQVGSRQARIITSIAMFYDIEDPLAFVREIAQVLADDGVWHFEQSYLPAMLQATAYDTICHEHLEYYGLTQIQWMMTRCGLRIIDVEFNDTNGGSFAVTVAKPNSPHAVDMPAIAAALQREEAMGLADLAPYEAFAGRTVAHKRDLLDALAQLRAHGNKVLGYGASTKGNVILQYCGITPRDLPAIADVNPDKDGCFTPGTWIPIISEEAAKRMKPDCFLVFPWHFRQNLLRREEAFLKAGGRMLFPLPQIQFIPQ